MLTPLVIGILILVANVVVQTAAVWVVIGIVVRTTARHAGRDDQLRGGLLLSGAVVLMFAGHLLQMGMWAISFVALGEFEGFAAAFYHSAVNFTSLGYGDVVMSERWRLLGALEAGSGILMFGVSTASFFAVIMRLSERRLQGTPTTLSDPDKRD
jgi:hypothetical protein